MLSKMTSRLAVRERAVDRPRSLRCRKARDFFDIDITFAGFEAVVRCTHPMPLLIERINVSSAAPFVSLYWIRICLCSDKQQCHATCGRAVRPLHIDAKDAILCGAAIQRLMPFSHCMRRSSIGFASFHLTTGKAGRRYRVGLSLSIVDIDSRVRFQAQIR
jgi:hypothetical protein